MQLSFDWMFFSTMILNITTRSLSMKITTPLLALALATMTVPLTSYAESDKQARCHQRASISHGPGQLSHEGFGLRGVPPHLAALNLSETQQDKVFELMHSQMPKARQAEKQRHQLIAELHKLANSGGYDESKVKLISEKLAVIEKEGVLSRASTHHQVYQILTPEQRKQLGEMKPVHDEGGFSKSRFERRQNHSGKLERTF
jgi:Spy/CpxP family protein refolding chaperone